MMIGAVDVALYARTLKAIKIEKLRLKVWVKMYNVIKYDGFFLCNASISNAHSLKIRLADYSTK